MKGESVIGRRVPRGVKAARPTVRTLMRRIVPRLVAWLQRAWPATACVVVRGYPDLEGNAVEIVRALARRYSGTVVWINGPSSEVLSKLGIATSERMNVLPSMRSLRALRAYLRAEVVLFTHGIYGEPQPARNRVTVNLWHGEPIKGGALFPHRCAPGNSSTYIVGSTSLLAARKSALAGLPISAYLHLGNPRTDGLFNPARPEELSAVGLEPQRPFVLWMPTFRVARSTSGSWSDTADTAAAAAITEGFRPCVGTLMAAGIQVAVRPHPLDSQSREVRGALVLDDGLLEEHGLLLYRLLGASAGLITDVSSVWIDYLMLDRPVGFFMPDKAAVSDRRDLFPAQDHGGFPGLELADTPSFEAFRDDVLGKGAATRDLRTQVRLRLGLTESSHVADDILTDLERRGAFRHGRLRPAEDDLLVGAPTSAPG